MIDERLAPDAAQTLFEELTRRMDGFMRSLKSHPQPEADTAFTRGQIKAVESLMEWVRPGSTNSAPAPEPEHRWMSREPHY